MAAVVVRELAPPAAICIGERALQIENKEAFALRKLAQPLIGLHDMSVDAVLVRLLAEQGPDHGHHGLDERFRRPNRDFGRDDGFDAVRARALRHFRVTLAHTRQRLRRIVGAEDVVDEAPQHDRARACGHDIRLEARQHLERLLTGNARVDDRDPVEIGELPARRVRRPEDDDRPAFV